MKRIVVIGGTGHFGARICRRLANEPNTEIVVTSRRLASAEAASRELRTSSAGNNFEAASLDHSLDSFAADLAALRADIVLHTAGPYQGQDYRVAEACIDCGCHYIDLADGRAFVGEFKRLDGSARERGVLLVSGASTLPGLSSAVIDHLKERVGQVRSIEMSIAPGHQTPRGPGTIAAVLSYCGKPFQVLSDGRWVTMRGWQNLKVQRYPDIGTRLSGACDVPDLGILPALVPGIETVTFHAALEAWWEQLSLWLMAGLTRAGIVRDWSKMVPTFSAISHRLIRLGSDTGAMRVSLTGLGHDGEVKCVSWHLLAQQNHGPEIPCIAAVILARKLTSDRLSMTGAMPCNGLISLEEFDAEIRDLDITWHIDESDA